ncbi:rhodanese-like domain-containing protein [Maritimibacter sp. UBA3975]|uniref:rhodanese-like domain-containing protein n=1 Tax=Maritimibacter sp. UBA3975 TaxID=1946833 RepID=UPI000C0B9890|nr:rhodanese-like domain-containing protein [Maritimibacter sp. UBA3975]MAM63755.1 sulfurtransferase [Maritimibacter sp.]|tara:strand:- start:16567 stop:17196 length:630 start_codon:yes stop_codon:yes gene_type:complete
MFRLILVAALACVITSKDVLAQEVRITPDTASFSVEVNGKLITIERNQDTNHKITNEFTKTSRPCPPFCIHPISAAPGVTTVGELEVIDFIETSVAKGNGLLIDSRLPEWFAKGTIPGAVNVPFATLEPSNPYRDQILQALGGVQSGAGWSFAAARDLTLFCNGPWCDQSPRAIRNLVDAGYPADKIRYYRGGMQLWLLLGLTVESPNA